MTTHDPQPRIAADGLYVRCAACGQMVPEAEWEAHAALPATHGPAMALVAGGQGRTAAEGIPVAAIIVTPIALAAVITAIVLAT